MSAAHVRTNAAADAGLALPTQMILHRAGAYFVEASRMTSCFAGQAACRAEPIACGLQVLPHHCRCFGYRPGLFRPARFCGAWRGRGGRLPVGFFAAGRLVAVFLDGGRPLSGRWDAGALKAVRFLAGRFEAAESPVSGPERSAESRRWASLSFSFLSAAAASSLRRPWRPPVPRTAE